MTKKPRAKTMSKKALPKNVPEKVNEGEIRIALPGNVQIVMVKIPRMKCWMGKFPVTQKQWEAVMRNNPSKFQAANNPVESVSVKDCRKFLRIINKLPAVKESKLNNFRLPTEYEWRKACRAGAKGKDGYCKLKDQTEIKEDDLKQVAWFKDNSKDHPHPVGRKDPNAYGLHDMLGNVWEWTLPKEKATSSPAKISAPKDNSSDDNNYFYLGGCWFNSAWGCRTSVRNWNSSSYKGRNIGFRLCADCK